VFDQQSVDKHIAAEARGTGWLQEPHDLALKTVNDMRVLGRTSDACVPASLFQADVVLTTCYLITNRIASGVRRHLAV